MIEVELDMNYIPTKWNCWSNDEGAWFNIYEMGKFKQGEKYRIILPTDVEGGINCGFFFAAFERTRLNPNDFEFPNYEKSFEYYKRFYNNH